MSLFAYAIQRKYFQQIYLTKIGQKTCFWAPVYALRFRQLLLDPSHHILNEIGQKQNNWC